MKNKIFRTLISTGIAVFASMMTALADQTVIVNPANAQAVINMVQDSPANRVTIQMTPGVYGPITVNDRERYINLIGGNDVVVRSDVGLYDTPAAELRINGVVKDITFISTHPTGATNIVDKGAYAAHLDYGSQHTVFEDCEFISYQTAGVGMGLTADSSVEFRKCTFANKGDGTFGTYWQLGSIYAHTDPLQYTGFGGTLRIVDSVFESPDGAYANVVAQNLNNTTMNYERVGC